MKNMRIAVFILMWKNSRIKLPFLSFCLSFFFFFHPVVFKAGMLFRVDVI